ncbi:hypothetical protein MASR2M15_15490 [Anaerolineales bacterium]
MKFIFNSRSNNPSVSDPEDIRAKNRALLVDVNQKIKNKPSAELHLERLHLLDNIIEDVPLIVSSLDWLSEHDPAQLEQARRLLNDEIISLLETLSLNKADKGEEEEEEEDELDYLFNRDDKSLVRSKKPKSGLLARARRGADDETESKTSKQQMRGLSLLEQLEPLADYFPIIHVSYGIILVEQSRKARETPKSPLQILEELLAGLDSNSDKPAKAPALKQGMKALLEQAYTHLSRGISLYENKDDPVRRAALQILAEVCESLNKTVEAYKAYSEMAEPDDAAGEKLNALAEEIQNQTRKRVLEYVDQLMKDGDFDKAEQLLDRVSPEEDVEDFKIRRADLAFLRGEFDLALDQYKNLLE